MLGGKKRILLVDDERDIAETMRFFLESKGYAVTVAYNGADALEKAREPHDLILLDVLMPGMDGFEVFRRLRSETLTEKVPVVMLTCKGDTQSIFDAQHMRVNDYLLKTCSFDELTTVVRKHLGESMFKSI